MVGAFLYGSPILFLRQVFSPSLELTLLVSLAAQQAPVSTLHTPSYRW